MEYNELASSIFLIFISSSLLATVTLFLRQPLLISYIIVGALLGPNVFSVISNEYLLSELATIGITFLLFLLGINLQPQNLWKLLKSTTRFTFISSFLFAILGFGLAIALGHRETTAFIVGACTMFSSTIIGLKLLPTTVLHRKTTGEIVISVLLLQDIIAIFILLIISTIGINHAKLSGNLFIEIFNIIKLFIYLPLFIFAVFFLERYLIRNLLTKYEKIHEYIFLMAIGWCLLCAEVTKNLGVSYEIGAFIAGVSLSRNPISFYISENLKQLRDFFLVLFFFVLGAHMNLFILWDNIIQILIIAGVFLIIKPILFNFLLQKNYVLIDHQYDPFDISLRLGQISEFSLLILYESSKYNFIDKTAYNVMQAVIIITFIVSSYIIINWLNTPLAVSDKLRAD